MASETVADIVTQLRVFVPIRLEGFDGDGLVVLDTAKLADRLEAAHERELADALDTGAFVAEAHKREVGVSKTETTTSANGASPRPWFVNGHSIEANDKSLWLQNEKTGRGIVANLPSAPKWRFAKAQRAEMDALTAANARLIVDAVNGAAGITEAETPTPTDKDSLQVGNNAKMREALVMVKRLFDERIMFQPAIREAHKAVNAALASPPRNCDRFNSFFDAADAWCKECLKSANPKPFEEWIFEIEKGNINEQ